ncbi:protein FAR1-RELATED SEQUENCE 5-like [Spinacia oleracea]|uniref:Protein FAR1-RELATED SEQUENCE 5-like n=1 Tax=Spinacia oleracea TaxID=3562 RepID=A0ABM3RRC4_SPIOL|nr:protein FAR1-RELATED SEQUENCE 5-like [Spinacia oleracea]
MTRIKAAPASALLQVKSNLNDYNPNHKDAHCGNNISALEAEIIKEVDNELDEEVVGEQCDLFSEEGGDEYGVVLGVDLSDVDEDVYKGVNEEPFHNDFGSDYGTEDDDYDEELDTGDDLDEEVFIGNDDDLNDSNDEDVGEDVGEDMDDVVIGEDVCVDMDEDVVIGEDALGNDDNPSAGEGVGSGLDGNNYGVYMTPTRMKQGPALATPVIGMSFSNWEALNNYYRSYGEQQGFGVVCVGGKTWPKEKREENGKSNSLKSYVWRCECYGRTNYRRLVNGKKVTLIEDPLVKKKSKECNCPVMLYGARDMNNSWVVKNVVNEHLNHNPTPRKSSHIPMFRQKKLTGTIIHGIVNDHDSGAPVAQIYNNLAGRRNGVENIGFTKKDIHNLLNRRMRLMLRDGDAAAMINYLDKMTKDNQKIFHLHRLDKTGKLQDVMWVDARSRAAYEYFGDVVCFDSTYLTNKYELPFSNFVGVNHHGQTILLGCALVSHEDAETFVWLFRSWLSCMGGKAPAAMMTDQDAAMRKAIRIAMPMPQTRHRWCMWHIMQKFSRKLGSLTEYPQIKVALQNVIYNSLTPEEFEEDWVAVIKTFELDTKKETKESYKWLEGLYNQREMWIPAYVKHIFWAGMQMTQRPGGKHQ